MAQKVIRLTESDIMRLVKNVLNEMNGYDDEDNDFQQELEKNFPMPKEKEYIPTKEDEAEFEDSEDDEFEDADVNNDPNRDEEDDFEDLDTFEGSDEGGEGDPGEPNNPGDPNDPSKPQGPVTPLSNNEPEPEEAHEEGDVIYFENIPITYTDGRFHMTIEDGYKSKTGNCPRIDVVGNSLRDVQNEYTHLWDDYYYSEHGQYAEKMIEDGKADYEVSDKMVIGDNMDLSDMTVLVDLDK